MFFQAQKLTIIHISHALLKLMIGIAEKKETSIHLEAITWFIVNITLCSAHHTLLTTLTVFKQEGVIKNMKLLLITFISRGASLGAHGACQLSTFKIGKTR